MMGSHGVLELLEEHLGGQRKWNEVRESILVHAEAEMPGFEEVDCIGTDGGTV